MALNKYLDIAPEVQKALDEGRPVVALESTIISHGMPYPQNVETALNVEKIIREGGAVPATIAIIGGGGDRLPGQDRPCRGQGQPSGSARAGGGGQGRRHHCHHYHDYRPHGRDLRVRHRRHRRRAPGG